MEARAASTGSSGGGLSGNADTRIANGIFRDRDGASTGTERKRPTRAPQGPARRRPGLY